MLPVLAACTGAVDSATRGIGIYPGDPSQSFAPELVADNEYRNIALNRRTYQSTAYDFNLTSQLITDGIVTTELPPYLTVSTPDGTLTSREREWSLDGGPYSFNGLKGERAWLEYHWNGMEVAADTIEITGVAYHGVRSTGHYDIAVQVADVADWKTSGRKTGGGWGKRASRHRQELDPNKQSGTTAIGERFTVTVPVDFGKTSDMRILFDAPGVESWEIHEVVFRNGGEADRDILPSFDFGSAWMSDGGGEQWVYVDLGNPADISQVILDWVEKPKSGCVEFSDDAVTWKSVAGLPATVGLSDTIDASGKARYVRVYMDEPGETGRYVLSEMQVMGRGGMIPVAHEIAAESSHNGKKEYSLNGGAWRLARASEVKAAGEAISMPSFDDRQWLVATVPSTVLSSYINAGAVPDPNFSDNMFNISESYFNSNFWYRTVFDYDASGAGGRVFLNFDGINWKADVYLNGKRIDRIEGAFVRSKTDVTDLLKPEGNVLAVEIEKVAHPGAVKEKNIETTDFNGGMLGLDNPTFHATIGWDWISTVRGRDIGIWNDVYLTAVADVMLLDPVVTSKLTFDSDTLASMTPCVFVSNHGDKEVTGRLCGWIGDVRFDRSITIASGEETEVCFSPEEYDVLKDRRMNLWWPVGYGQPDLYDAGFEFVTDDGKVSDRIDFKAGIREMTYADPMTRLTMYVNGKRFIPLGGNWGFSEHNLNYRGREYDIAVKYHRDMNFNMIRNWVGQTGDEEFYEACDRYGVMVMQDFWLANPVDGPNPGDEDMFVSNAEDYVKRIRRHPSIAFYCGRNEGDPTPSLNAAFESIVSTLNPGLLYIPNSADYGLTGHGPYGAEPDSVYFAIQTGKFHSERGLPNVMTPEGLKRTFGEEIPWPQDNLWGQHDYTQKGAQRGASFNRILESKIGMPDDPVMFGKMAQWENYDAYRAMFESSQTERMGLVIWMSHSCWPSLTWDTYDYYFEPTAAFFGSKKACEPLHVQWNPITGCVQVVNIASGRYDNLEVEARVLGVKGNEVDRKTATVATETDTTKDVFEIKAPSGMTEPLFLCLTLKDGDRLVSENVYAWGAGDDGLKSLTTLPAADIDVSAKDLSPTGRVVTLTNNGTTVVPLVRLNLKGSDGDQILPVDYSDNYFHMMPGETRSVNVSWNKADARGGKVAVEVSALNLEPKRLAL